MERIAVIDLGSNSVRMTITRLFEDGSHRMVESARAMVRLSEGMGREALLAPEPMERTLDALSLFRRLMEVHQVTTVYPVATAAVRQATNATTFLEAVQGRTGLSFTVISGEEEAHLDFLGVANTISLKDFAMIDIGGASTEIVVVRNREAVGKISIPWGAVNLTEQYQLSGKPSRKKREAAMEELVFHLASSTWIPQDPGLPLVGLGGTIRALAKADRNRRNWPIEALHQYEMTSDGLGEWMELLSCMDTAARRAVPGIGRERADILPGALLPLRALLSHLGSQRVVISGSGIREGLFYRHLGRTLDWQREVVGDVRLHAVENLMRLHEAESAHTRHVRELTLSLFDGFLPLHGLGEEARELLGYAALLHDVGMHLDYYHHHRHGQYLVLNSEMNGFTHREKLLVSLLVGMHRADADLREDLSQFDLVLEMGDRSLLRRMALCLMLAEQLDRGESGAITSVKVKAGVKSIRLAITTHVDVALEIASAMRCAASFEREYERRLQVSIQEGNT